MTDHVIGYAGKPQRTAWQVETDRLIFENVDTRVCQCPLDPRSVEPPIMIAKHGEDAITGLQFLQPMCGSLGFDEVAEQHATNDEVAKNDDDVRLQPIDFRDDSIDFGEVYMRRTDVKVGYHRDS